MSRNRHLLFRASAFVLSTLLCLAIGSPSAAQNPAYQVIVHIDNEMAEISAQTASKIFLRKITRWPSGASITPFDLTTDAPARAAFSREVHRKSVGAISTFWQRMIFSNRGVPPQQRGARENLEAVRTQPGAIAYVPSGIDLPPEVKRLRITGHNQLDAFTEGDPADIRKEPAPAYDQRDRTAPLDDSAPAGALLALAIPPASSDTVWASFQDHGLWNSIDGGRTWAFVPSSPDQALQALAFDPVDPQLLLVGGESGLYRSLDLGETWQLATDESGQPTSHRGIRSISSLPQSPGTFFVHTHQALLRSLDHGASFANLPLPGPPRAFVIDPSSGDLWLATAQTLEVSQDHGESWTTSAELAELLPGAQILVASLSGLKTLWVTVDHALWRAGFTREGLVDTLQPSLSNEVQRLYAADDTIYAATEQGVFQLADDGQSWLLASEIRGAILAADPYGSGRLLAGNREGRVWRREHPNAPWRHLFYILDPQPSALTLSHLTKPPPPLPLIPLRLRCSAEPGHVGALAVHPNDRGVLWAGSEHGVFRSDDGGLSWGPPGRGLEISDVHSLSVDPKTPNTLWAGTFGDGVYVSRDGGDSWAPIPDLRGTAIHEVVVDPLVPDLLYASTAGGVLVSRDRGTHWHTLTALSESGHPLFDGDPSWQITPRALAVNPDHAPMALSDDRGRLYEVHAVSATRRSLPGLVHLPKRRLGKSVCAEDGRRAVWRPKADLLHQLPLELPLRDLTFADSPDHLNVLWAATAFGVWRGSEDDSAPWTRLALQRNVAALAVDSRHPELVYAGAADGLWRSADGGATWQRWGVEEAVFSLVLDPGLAELVYVGLAGGRIATVRSRSKDPEPEVARAAVPWRIEDPVDPALLHGVSSVLRLDSEPPPEDAGFAFWQATRSTPPTASRLRALYAAEALGRVSGLLREETRDLLLTTLGQIRGDLEAHGREIPSKIGLSPDGRWLFSEWRFDDGLRSHSELRLYDSRTQGWHHRPGPPLGASKDPAQALTWQRLHDLALEPQHLRPSWLFEDPGACLTWNDSGTRLATHAGPDRILVWELPHLVPERMGRPPRPRSVQLERGQNPCGARSVLSDGGSWMAVAKHSADRFERTASLSLWRLGDDAPKRTLDVLTRSKDDPSPYFTKLVFTGDARHLLGFREDGSAQVWAVSLALENEPESLPGDSFKTIHRGPRGRWMATVTSHSQDSELQLWPLRKDGWFTPLSLTSGSTISRVRFHNDESWLSAVVDGRRAELWDLSAEPSPQKLRESSEEARQEVPSATLAATAAGTCTALFNREGNWLTHESSASRIWHLHEADADDRLVRSKQPRPKAMAGGGTCRALPRSARITGPLAVGRRASHEMLALWNLEEPELRHLSAQMQRFGPAELHSDEGALRSPVLLAEIWPEQALDELSDGALRALACQVVGRPLHRAEWSFAMGNAEYRPLCPPLPEPLPATP